MKTGCLSFKDVCAVSPVDDHGGRGGAIDGDGYHSAAESERERGEELEEGGLPGSRPIFGCCVLSQSGQQRRQ